MGKSTELVTWDGKRSTANFSLEYELSFSCGIPDPDTDTIIVTGGYNSATRVSQYDKMGNMKKLASLNTGRSSHGCAQFTENGVKVLLVTGGWGRNTLSSTEILRMEGPSFWRSWSLTLNGDLPLP